MLYAIEEDGNPTLTKQMSETPDANGSNGALDENDFSEAVNKPLDNKGQQGPVQFAFDTPVQRIFSCPLGGLWFLLSVPKLRVLFVKVYLAY